MKLSILTVSYGHRTLLLENVRLSISLNQGFFKKVEWHVAENSPRDHPDRFHGDEFGLIVQEAQSEKGLGISHHHATALNHLLRTTSLADHVLILDPDFFLLVPDWVEVITAYMSSKKLDFFGVPWHPRHSENYRYFPAVHCFAFDSRRIPVNTLDFTPLLDHLAWREKPVARAIRFIPMVGYRLIARSWDTGSRIHERYSRDPRYTWEVTVPVYSPNPRYSSRKNRLIEALLPDALCLEPKHTSYYTDRTFVDRGWIKSPLPDQWESFAWNERPFGIHVRRSYASHSRNDAEESSHLSSLLAQLREAIST